MLLQRCVLTLFGIAVHLLVVAQGQIKIVDPPRCPECRLELTLQLTLRDRPDLSQPVVGVSSSVVRDGAGRIFLAHNDDPTRIQVFTRDGNFERSLGSSGQGPGEFIAIGGLTLNNEGELVAFDRFQARMTVFSPTLELIEVKRLPIRVTKGLFAQRGGLVVAAHSYSEDLVGLPLHFLAADLSIAKSFGAADEVARPDMQIVQFRSIAKSVDGLIWSAPYHKYLAEEWDPSTGLRQTAFERDVDWFRPWFFDEPLSIDNPPQPRFEGVWYADGLLWTLAAVAADDWRDGLYAASDDMGIRVRDLARLYDTYIEVIDLSTGVLLLSEKVPQYLTGFTNDGMMIGFREPENDTPYLDLWKATLIR